ncbi:hypothetical protein, partial [Shewanella sp.]|uniref:hypothetical protein n=1 Tax=Shewanella sp. TaxID=50422 RepID=UPI003D10F6D2
TLASLDFSSVNCEGNYKEEPHSMSRLYANSSVPKKATMTSKCVGGESFVLLVVTTLALTAEYIRRISALRAMWYRFIRRSSRQPNCST